jgi:hypothetical protein
MSRCGGAALEGASECRTAEERGDRGHRQHGDQEQFPLDATEPFPGPVPGVSARRTAGVAGPEEQVVQVRLEGKQCYESLATPTPWGLAATIVGRTAYIRYTGHGSSLLIGCEFTEWLLRL